MTLQTIKAAWLKALIAYHRRKASSYSQPLAGSYRRDHYQIWLRNMALRHTMKAHDLERKLSPETA